MARQRFIWPSMWADKSFGELKHEQQVLFIALYSLADDDGRISADPMYLRAQVFPYKDYTVKKVETIRNGVVERMRNVHMYIAGPNNEPFIELRKWKDYQKPKYPTPSKIPPSFPESSSGVGEQGSNNLPTGWVGLGRDGMDRVGLGPPDGGEKPAPNVDEVIRGPECPDCGMGRIRSMDGSRLRQGHADDCPRKGQLNALDEALAASLKGAA